MKHGVRWMSAGLMALVMGCETVTWEVEEQAPGATDLQHDGTGTRPASLVEMDMREGGQVEVTKNLPKDAAVKVRDAVRPPRPVDESSASE